MHRSSSSSSNTYTRNSFGSSSNGNSQNHRSNDRFDRRGDNNRENTYQNGSMNHSSSNRQKQMNSLDEIKNLPKPNWTQQTLRPFEKKFFCENECVQSRPFQEVKNFLTTHSITVAGPHQVRPALLFADLNIPRDVMHKIQELKYDRPTPIQSMSWPSLLNGNDLVGIAQTGSGKTFGFILPMLIHIINNQRYVRSFGREDLQGPVGLVVAPTRELAMQIQTVADEFGTQLGIKNIVIYGGAPKHTQLQQIRRGAEIYIATPGRLIDFVKENQVSLSRCTFLVLDEADRMLDMGFEPQIRKIIEQIRPDRQTAMFSATWPKEVRKLAEDFISNYVHVNIGHGELTANPNIKQIIEVCQEYEKEGRLREILAQIMTQRDSKAIVFAETKKKVDMYSKLMQNMGFHCLAIHGDKKQQEREWVLNEFKKKPKSILCATDVAARGLNISDIKFVINIDYPMQTEDYIHRIGRTARNSNTGTAYTFITSENAKHVPKLIEILREGNQQVSDSLLAMSRSNGYNGRNMSNRYQRPSYNQNEDRFNGNGNGQAYKRTAPSVDESENYNRNDTNGHEKRVKRNRWDESTWENDVKTENVFNGQNGHNGSYNGYQNGNKYQNGGAANGYTNGSIQQVMVPLMKTGRDQVNHSYSPAIPSSLPAPPKVTQMAPPLQPAALSTQLAAPLLASTGAVYSAYANYF